MKKSEAEPILRRLYHQWREDRHLPLPSGDPAVHYSFIDFKSWLEEKHLGNYLKFRSTGGADDEAERWFDQEMRQAWRN